MDYYNQTLPNIVKLTKPKQEGAKLQLIKGIQDLLGYGKDDDALANVKGPQTLPGTSVSGLMGPDEAGLLDESPMQAPKGFTSQTHQPDGLVSPDLKEMRSWEQEYKDSLKKPVIVNPKVSKDGKTNTETQEIARGNEDKGSEKPFAGILKTLGLDDVDWKKVRRNAGNAIVEGSEYARFNVNYSGNNPSAYVQGRTTKNLEDQQKANDQYDTNVDPNSDINKQLGDLINERLAKRGKPGLKDSTMDREERMALLKELDFMDKMANDEAYRKAQISSLNRRGTGSSTRTVKAGKLGEGERQSLAGMGGAIEVHRSIANRLNKFVNKQATQGNTDFTKATLGGEWAKNNLPFGFAKTTDPGYDTTSDLSGFNSAAELETAFVMAAAEAEQVLQKHWTGAAGSEAEKKRIEANISILNKPLATIEEKMAALAHNDILLSNAYENIKRVGQGELKDFSETPSSAQILKLKNSQTMPDRPGSPAPQVKMYSGWK